MYLCLQIHKKTHFVSLRSFRQDTILRLQKNNIYYRFIKKLVTQETDLRNVDMPWENVLTIFVPVNVHADHIKFILPTTTGDWVAQLTEMLELQKWLYHCNPDIIYI